MTGAEDPTESQRPGRHANGVAQVGNRLGLHARPYEQIQSVAMRFSSQITLSYNGKAADAKSALTCIMQFENVPCGAEVGISASGRDAVAAVEGLKEIIQKVYEPPL